MRQGTNDMNDSNKLLTCEQFREIRDEMQARRRIQVLPQLTTQKDGLSRDLGVLYRQYDRASKHDKQLIESNMKPLQWAYQETVAQLAVIESWLPSCPERWRVTSSEIIQTSNSSRPLKRTA